MNVRFKKWDCKIEFGKYANERIAMRLLDVTKEIDDPDSLVAVATVNIPTEWLSNREVIIKDYSENKGMLEALSKCGVIGAPKRYIESGYITCPVCDLLLMEDYKGNKITT